MEKNDNPEFPQTREERMQSVLLWLHERGGLGHDVHARILKALGTPNGHFCRQARVCLKAKRCMSDIVCND